MCWILPRKIRVGSLLRRIEDSSAYKAFFKNYDNHRSFFFQHKIIDLNVDLCNIVQFLNTLNSKRLFSTASARSSIDLTKFKHIPAFDVIHMIIMATWVPASSLHLPLYLTCLPICDGGPGAR